MSHLLEHPIVKNSNYERRLLVLLSMIRNPPSTDEILAILEHRLNWPWIIMQAMHHRTLCVLWHTIKTRNLMKYARRSGLSKNWIAYCEQLTRASAKRNTLWFTLFDKTLLHLKNHDIDVISLKGTALIGDIYEPKLRMLGDIDTLIHIEDRSKIKAALESLDYQSGTLDPVNNVVTPLSNENIRFWNFHSKIMPKFTLLTGDENVPFLRLAVGFNLFDPGAEYSISSDTLFENSEVNPNYKNSRKLDVLDTIICQCSHVYREATSDLFTYISDSWHLWKFGDIRELLFKYDSPELKHNLLTRGKSHGVIPVLYFAIKHTYFVYGDELLLEWIEFIELNSEILTQKSHEVSSEFAEVFFDPHPASLKTEKPEWAKQMSNGEWW